MEVTKNKMIRADRPRGNDPGWYLELKEDMESLGQGTSVSKEFFEYCLSAFTESKSHHRSFPLGSSNSKLNHSAVTFRELPKAPPMTSTRTGLDQELKAIWAKKDEKQELSPIKLESNILGLSNVTLRSLEDESFEPFDYTKVKQIENSSMMAWLQVIFFFSSICRWTFIVNLHQRSSIEDVTTMPHLWAPKRRASTTRLYCANIIWRGFASTKANVRLLTAWTSSSSPSETSSTRVTVNSRPNLVGTFMVRLELQTKSKWLIPRYHFRFQVLSIWSQVHFRP